MENISTQRKAYLSPRISTPFARQVSHWQLPDDKEYLLETIAGETELGSCLRQQKYAKKLLAKDTKCVTCREKIFYTRNVTPEEMEILRKLKGCGVATEVPFNYELVTLDGVRNKELAPMGFLDAGIRILNIYNSLTNEEKKQLFEKIAIITGRMHKHGIEHGHPTLGNIFMDNQGRITIADFSLAEMKSVNWQSAEGIFNDFKRDYCSNITRAKARINEINYWIMFFRKMVGEYPAADKIKQEIKKRILEILGYCWAAGKIRPYYLGFK